MINIYIHAYTLLLLLFSFAIEKETINIQQQGNATFYISPSQTTCLVSNLVDAYYLKKSWYYNFQYTVDDGPRMDFFHQVVNVTEAHIPSIDFTLSLGKGDHNIKVFLIGNINDVNHGTPVDVTSDDADVHCIQQYYITVKNNFSAGTIYVDDPSKSDAPKSSGFQVLKNENAKLKIEAIDQYNAPYQRVWNSTGVSASISQWQRKKSTSQTFSDITTTSPKYYEYTTQAYSEDAGATVQADMKKLFKISRIDQTDFDGSQPAVEVNQIVEQNSGDILAEMSKTINYRNYLFYKWSNGVTTNQQTLYPTDNQTITALYKGHFLTTEASDFQSNGSHKFIRTGDGTLHLVYSSLFNGERRMFYETSSDNGSTWLLRYSDYGSTPAIAAVNNSRVMFVYPYGSGILKSACYDLTTQSVISSSSLLGQAPYDSPSDVAIAITTGGKIAVTYYNDFQDNDNYYIPGYYGMSGSVASNGAMTWGYAPSYEYGGFTSPTARHAALEVRIDAGEGLFHFAFDDDDGYGGRQIYYGPIIRDANYLSQHVYSPYVNCISGSSGFNNNTNPSLIPVANEGLRLNWIGDNGMEKMSVFKAPDYWRYWNFGSDVTSTSINQASSGGYVIGWSDGSSHSYTNSSTLYTLGSISSTGKYIQIGNHSSMTSMMAMGFNETNLPYHFNLSSPIGSQQLQKNTSNEAAVRGRGGIISIQKIINPHINRDSTKLRKPNIQRLQFAFSVNNVTVNGNSINFVDVPDSVKCSDLKDLNKYLITEPFSLNDKSIFTFDITNSAPKAEMISELLADSKYINFKVELVDAESQRVLGVSEEVNQTKNQAIVSQKIGFGIDCKGIGNKKAVLRIVVNTNTDAQYALSENVVKASEILKKKPQQRSIISYQGQRSVTSFELKQNYPNPFNPSTTINYSLPKPDLVSLTVYDALGREVAQLVNSHQESGRYSVDFDASKISSGMYIYKLTSGSYSQTKKMMLVK